MKYDVIKNIRKNNIKIFLVMMIFASIPNIFCIYYLIEDGLQAWFPILLFGTFAVLFNYALIKTLIIIINPYKSNIFKKYGNIKELQRIMTEIEESIEYEDSKIIVAKNYVADKKDFEKILSYKDILKVHKLVHKTNFVIDRYDVVITDKYNFETSYSYSAREEEKVDRLILLIGSKCDNAMLGYSKESSNYVKQKKEELPKQEKDIPNITNNSGKYACPDCNNIIEFGDKFCKNCGCKIDWE